MLDINSFRINKGGNPDIIKESERRRYPISKSCSKEEIEKSQEQVLVVDKVIEIDEKWRKKRTELDKILKYIGQMNKEISIQMKEGKIDQELIEKKKQVEKEIIKIEKEEKEMIEERDQELNKIGNIIHEDVPVSLNEKYHEIIQETQKSYSIERIEEYIKGDLYNLYISLKLFTIEYLKRKGYNNMILCPYFIKKNNLIQLNENINEYNYLYKDLYLLNDEIYSILYLYENKRLDETILPIHYLSNIYLKNDNIYLSSLSSPRQNESTNEFYSEEIFNEYLELIKEYLNLLEIDYKIISIISNQLKKNEIKRYKIQLKINHQYIDLSYISNTTDYLTRSLDIKFRKNSLKNKGILSEYCHYIHSKFINLNLLFHLLKFNHIPKCLTK